MPYCPKCDMEFVDGITVCSDCGGALMESEEAAKAARKEQEAQELQAQLQAHEEWMKEMETTVSDDEESEPEKAKEAPAPIAPTKLYVNKEQKYEDHKSAASAFLIVGAVLLAFSLLCWGGIINLPMSGVTKLIFYTALTLMGGVSILISISSSKSAKQLAPQIADENNATQELIQWFTDSYDGDAIDRVIADAEALSPEELSLKRFQVIQDYLITRHDLPDAAYVDALSEEIYSKLYD